MGSGANAKCGVRLFGALDHDTVGINCTFCIVLHCCKYTMKRCMITDREKKL